MSHFNVCVLKYEMPVFPHFLFPSDTLRDPDQDAIFLLLLVLFALFITIIVCAFFCFFRATHHDPDQDDVLWVEPEAGFDPSDLYEQLGIMDVRTHLFFWYFCLVLFLV